MLARIRRVLASPGVRKGVQTARQRIRKGRKDASIDENKCQREAWRTKRDTCRTLSEGPCREHRWRLRPCRLALHGHAPRRNCGLRTRDPTGRQGTVARRLRAAIGSQRVSTVLSSGKRLSWPIDLRRLTEIDFRDHVAIVLTVGAGSDRTPDRRRPLRSRGLRRGPGRGGVHGGRRLSTSWCGERCSCASSSRSPASTESASSSRSCSTTTDRCSRYFGVRSCHYWSRSLMGPAAWF